MGKLGNLSLKVPAQYEPMAFREIISAICGQSDSVSEGRTAAKYNATSVTPSGSVAAYAVADQVPDLNATVGNSIVPGLPIQFVRLGWVWTAPGNPGTFKEIRVPTGALSTSVPNNVALASDGAGGFGFRTLTSADIAASGIVTMGSPVASTSGTSIDFTGIPPAAKEITISLSGVSTNGTASLRLQLGDSGGIETTGYLGSVNNTGTISRSTSGFDDGTGSAAAIRHGQFKLTLENASANTWSCSFVLGRSDSDSISIGGGVKSTSAALDRVRVTTSNGTDAFDAGEINIAYL